MKIFVKEQLSAHKYKTPQGYLVCVDAIIARTGKQTYKKRDFFPDAADGDIDMMVDRPEEEVFSEEAKASFENMPITVEHPYEEVTSENWKQHSVGFVRDIHEGEFKGHKVLLGNLIIQDEKTIQEIENGEHVELSCGYDCDVEDEDNPVQRHIRGNHVALCAKGRAGIAKIVDTAPSRTKDTARTITVQCYILSRDGKQLLTQERPGPSWPGIAVPGGHVKVDETPLEACVREVREETGLEVRQLRLFGTHQYECEEDGPSIALLFTTTDSYGDLHQSDEGLNKWYPVEQVLASPKCADGLQSILSKLLDGAFVGDSTTKVEELGETRFIEYDDKEKKYYIASGDSRFVCGFDTAEEAKEFWFKNKDFIRKRVAKDTVVDVEPKEGESKEDFISRFMSTTKEEYPDEKQRLAVAHSYWEKAHSKDAYHDDKFDDLCELLDKHHIDYSDAGYNPSMFWFISKSEFDKAKVLLEKSHRLRTAINKRGHYVIEVMDSVKDGFYTEAQKADKSFVKSALEEMRWYVRNWNYMSPKDKRNVGCTLQELHQRIAELSSVSDCNDSTTKDSSKESLIKALDVLATKFKLLRDGKTWTDKHHFEFESVDKVDDFRTQMMLIDKVIDRFDSTHNCHSTYNAVLKSDGHINIVIDVDDKLYHDSLSGVQSAQKVMKIAKIVSKLKK